MAKIRTANKRYKNETTGDETFNIPAQYMLLFTKDVVGSKDQSR